MDKEIENLYKQYYPRKIGKTKGIKTLLRSVRDADGLAKLEAAIKNYSQYTKDIEAEERFIKHFSTFASEWEDWLEYQPKTRTLDFGDR